MMLWLEYSGWFQCRLATDPDPSDEGRGVSGYVHAVPGEPDLDRVVRLQPTGTVPRSHCPPIAVTVNRLFAENGGTVASPIVGAAVELLDNPKFEGKNHIIAEDGFEPIVPFHLRISKGSFLLDRKFDDTMQFPPRSDADWTKLQQLQAGGVVISPGAIGAATGIFSLAQIWRQRSSLLDADLRASTNEVERAALKSRIRAMSDPRNARFFGARMMYSIPLSGTALVSDPDRLLGGTPQTGSTPWLTDFWCGAWDPDAMCGYLLGYLGLPIDDPGFAPGVAAMMSDRRQERR